MRCSAERRECESEGAAIEGTVLCCALICCAVLSVLWWDYSDHAGQLVTCLRAFCYIVLQVANSLSVEGGAGVSQSVLDGLFDEVYRTSNFRLRHEQRFSPLVHTMLCRAML
jgi:hypothetical protein